MSHTTSADARTELSTADAVAALSEGDAVHVEYDSVHSDSGTMQTIEGEVVDATFFLTPAEDDGSLSANIALDTEGDGDADTRLDASSPSSTDRVTVDVETLRSAHDAYNRGVVTHRDAHWRRVSELASDTVLAVPAEDDEEDADDEPAIAPAEDRHGEPIEEGDVVRIKYDGEFTHGVVSAVAGQYHTGRSEGARRINIQLPLDVDNASGWTTMADERVTVVGTHEPVSGGYGLLVDEAELLADSDLHAEAAEDDEDDDPEADLRAFKERNEDLYDDLDEIVANADARATGADASLPDEGEDAEADADADAEPARDADTEAPTMVVEEYDGETYTFTRDEFERDRSARTRIWDQIERHERAHDCDGEAVHVDVARWVDEAAVRKHATRAGRLHAVLVHETDDAYKLRTHPRVTARHPGEATEFWLPKAGARLYRLRG